MIKGARNLSPDALWRLANGRYFLFQEEILDVYLNHLYKSNRFFSLWDSAYRKCCCLGIEMLSLDVDHNYYASCTSCSAPGRCRF